MFPHIVTRGELANRRQVAENGMRLAFSWGFASTSGWGEFEIPDAVEFDCAFIDEPAVTYGYSLDGDKLVKKRFPRAWGGVSKWLQDERGFFVGAHVFVVVDTLSPAEIAGVPEADPNYDLDHTWQFAGTGIKALSDIIDEFDE
jgi:hypothetical protein